MKNIVKKSMALALILSIIITGLSLVYDGEWKKWLKYIAVSIILELSINLVFGINYLVNPQLGLNATTLINIIVLIVWIN